MKTTDIKITKLKLAEYNPRRISDKELSNLRKSLEKYGFIQPVVINKDFTVISGHQRIRAWKELKNETVPVIQLSITKTEEKALNLAMNRIGGEWDMEKLYSVMNDLRVTDELEFTGFDEKEVSKILDQFLEDEEEDSTDKLLERLPAKAKKGEIYELGNHRLMCGDSTSLDDVMKLTADHKEDILIKSTRTKQGGNRKPKRIRVCEKCGKKAAHYDYKQKLKVRWLCRSCHVKWDKNKPKNGTKSIKL